MSISSMTINGTAEPEWIPAQGSFHNVFGSLTDKPAGVAVVQGGVDLQGRPLYVVRAQHNSAIYPGKHGFHLRGAHIAYAGEKIVNYYEVLICTAGQYQWHTQCGKLDPSNMDGFIPVKASNEEDPGKALYIARARIPGGTVQCGRVQENGIAQVSFGGKEIYSEEYDVLVFSSYHTIFDHAQYREPEPMHIPMPIPQPQPQSPVITPQFMDQLQTVIRGLETSMTESATVTTPLLEKLHREVMLQGQRILELQQLVREMRPGMNSALQLGGAAQRGEEGPSDNSVTGMEYPGSEREDWDMIGGEEPVRRAGGMIGFDPDSQEAGRGRGLGFDPTD